MLLSALQHLPAFLVHPSYYKNHNLTHHYYPVQPVLLFLLGHLQINIYHEPAYEGVLVFCMLLHKRIHLLNTKILRSSTPALLCSQAPYQVLIIARSVACCRHITRKSVADDCTDADVSRQLMIDHCSAAEHNSLCFSTFDSLPSPPLAPR